jgi:hypothetical protein
MAVKPPSRNSLLGMVIMTASHTDFLTCQEIFKRGFRPNQNFESVEQTVGQAQRRDPPVLERKYGDGRRPERYRLTEEGQRIKDEYRRQMALRCEGPK